MIRTLYVELDADPPQATTPKYADIAQWFVRTAVEEGHNDPTRVLMALMPQITEAANAWNVENNGGEAEGDGT